MKLSIITSTYNCEKYIQRLCTSVKSLSALKIDYEWIIQDGSSSDSTLQVINGYKELNVLIESMPDLGIYDAWNKALLRVSGDLVIFLGADDFVEDWSSILDIKKLDAINCFGLNNYSNKQKKIKDSIIFFEADFGRKLDMPIHAFPPVPSMLFPSHLFNNFTFDIVYKYHADGLFLYHACMNAEMVFHSKYLTFMGDEGVTSGYENRLSRWFEKYRIYTLMKNNFTNMGYIHINLYKVIFSGFKFFLRQVFYVIFKR